MRANCVASPFVVAPIAEHELQLVIRPQMFEVAPSIPRRLATAGTFQVNDASDSRVDHADVAFARGLDHHVMSTRQQQRNQWMDSLLQEWLAAGNFDQPAIEAVNFGCHLRNLHLIAFVKGVLGVAPGAAQVAPREADEDAGTPRPGRFALDAMKDLVNADPRHFSQAGGAQRPTPPP